ncbi:putative type VI secretion system effector, partial [Acinetobacter sp. ETR1]|uniref:putative type VI secretion system effector n=2 Tax=Moraxellaceae TaxID=468 RepID=UPI0004D767E1
QIGNAALASFAASDDGIEVSDFAIEITDENDQKHYFKGCFPVVMFKKGDMVKVIAEPLSGQNKYAYAATIIDQKNSYTWTGQEVVKGRFRYRIFGMKLMGGVCLFVMFIQLIIDYFISDTINQMLFSDTGIQITALIALIVFTGIGWRIGASFDGQSIELEAILKKLGFNKPSRMDLQHYALNDLSWKNKEDNKGYVHERWKDYTYRIDLAKQYDEEKYGKK